MSKRAASRSPKAPPAETAAHDCATEAALLRLQSNPAHDPTIAHHPVAVAHKEDRSRFEPSNMFAWVDKRQVGPFGFARAHLLGVRKRNGPASFCRRVQMVGT